jgi:hypothetical protein
MQHIASSKASLGPSWVVPETVKIEADYRTLATCDALPLPYPLRCGGKVIG